ncbi:LutC/YkgG family protein [Enterococcus faecalis]
MENEAIQNREPFLQNLREKLGIERQPVSAHPFTPINQLPTTQLAEQTPNELLAITKERVAKIRATLVETTKENLGQTLKEWIKNFGGGSVLLPTDERFAAYGLTEFYEGAAFGEAKLTCWQPGNEMRQENLQKAANANIAIAFAEYLLAESGTVVVESSAGQGRSLHFLPKHYLSIIPMSRLVPRSTQPAAYYTKQVASGAATGSAIHFISGPSNSGDIEMQLVVGLHGPLEVCYVVITDC